MLPDCEDPRVTWPLYIVLPVPVSTACHSVILAPVLALVTTCNSFGVPSCWSPPTTVSNARTGAPSAAQITLRAPLEALASLEPSAPAAETAWLSAAAGVTVALVSATLISWWVALVTLLVTPSLAWTVRSPPSTGSPS